MTDPSDNAKIWEVANLDGEDAKGAIEAAQAAFSTYRKTSHRERRWLMRRWADLIRENADDLAAICTLELGKPFTESLVTVKVLSCHLPFAAENYARQMMLTLLSNSTAPTSSTGSNPPSSATTARPSPQPRATTVSSRSANRRALLLPSPPGTRQLQWSPAKSARLSRQEIRSCVSLHRKHRYVR